MRLNDIKVGDLVRFNSAGQKYKTLGMVMAFDYRMGDLYTERLVQIQWHVIGDIMPRRCSLPQEPEPYWETITPGKFSWHKMGNWFEHI